MSHLLPELVILSRVLEWGSVCPPQAESWPCALSKEDLGALGAGGHQRGHGESWAASAGGGVLAPYVFALSCPAQAFPR